MSQQRIYVLINCHHFQMFPTLPKIFVVIFGTDCEVKRTMKCLSPDYKVLQNSVGVMVQD